MRCTKGIVAGRRAGASGPAIDAAILAAMPLSYWKLGDSDLTDYGSLAIDLIPSGSFSTVTGPDGAEYPQGDGTAGLYMTTGVDSIDYERDISVMVMYKRGSTATTYRALIAKRDAVSGGSWRLWASGTGGMDASTYTAAGAVARQRISSTSFSGTDDWHILFALFPAGATSYATIRADGAFVFSGSLGGTGSATSDSSAEIRLFAPRSGETCIDTLAHVAIFDGVLNEATMQSIESAAEADGWGDFTP